MPKKIFITGISGCVGHYLYDQFRNDSNYHLYVLLRRPERLRFDPAQNPNITCLPGDLSGVAQYKDIIGSCQYLIHAAACFGSAEINHSQSLELLNLVDKNVCRKIIYISTASILGEGNVPIREAEKFGTPYIVGKYKMFKDLPELAVYDKITTLFPTVVLGGDKFHTFSHISLALKKLPFYLKIVRFFAVDGGFHFMHAEDIAKISKYLLEHETPKKEYVLGNDYVTFEEFIDSGCKYFKIKRPFKVKIGPGFVKAAAKILRIQISPWGMHCLGYRHFKYETTSAKTFGLSSNCVRPADIFNSLVEKHV